MLPKSLLYTSLCILSLILPIVELRINIEDDVIGFIDPTNSDEVMEANINTECKSTIKPKTQDTLANITVLVLTDCVINVTATIKGRTIMERSTLTCETQDNVVGAPSLAIINAATKCSAQGTLTVTSTDNTNTSNEIDVDVTCSVDALNRRLFNNKTTGTLLSTRCSTETRSQNSTKKQLLTCFGDDILSVDIEQKYVHGRVKRTCASIGDSTPAGQRVTSTECKFRSLGGFLLYKFKCHSETSLPPSNATVGCSIRGTSKLNTVNSTYIDKEDQYAISCSVEEMLNHDMNTIPELIKQKVNLPSPQSINTQSKDMLQEYMKQR